MEQAHVIRHKVRNEEQSIRQVAQDQGLAGAGPYGIVGAGHALSSPGLLLNRDMAYARRRA